MHNSCILFLIFLIIGIKSFASLKKISETGERQNNLEKEISDWFIEEYKDQMLVQFDDFFEDAPPKEKEPKKIQCPHCGEWFEI